MIRGIVKSVVEGLIKRFSATGRIDEDIDDREYFQHYGFTSRPLEDAEIIIISEDNHVIAIASDDRRYRIAIEDGEVALYTDEGDTIHLKRDNTIEIISGNKLIATVENEVEITTKTATINATESCVVNCPSVQLGGSSGTMRFLMDERLIAWLTGHTHNSGSVPDQELPQANVCTSIVKAG